MSTTRPAGPKAPAIDPAWRGDALVLCAHGIGGRPGTAQAHAGALGRRGLFAEVRAGCLKGRPSLAEAVAATAARRVHVVPLLMADGHTFRTVLPCALAEARRPGRELILHPPVGLNPHLGALIAAQAEDTCRARGWAPSQTAVLLVAHGTPKDNGSRAGAERHARALSETGRFAQVATAFLDDLPGVPEALARLSLRRCVAVGLFADAGPHGRDDVARLVAPAGDAAVYAGPVGTNPGFAGLILEHMLSRAGAARPTAAA